MSQTVSISLGPVAALLLSRLGLSCAQICVFLAFLCGCALALTQLSLVDVVAKSTIGRYTPSTPSEKLVIGSMAYATFSAHVLLATTMVAGSTDARVKFHNERLYMLGFTILSAFGIPGSMVGAKLKVCFGARLMSAAYLLSLVVAAINFDRAKSENDFFTGFGAVGVGLGLGGPTVPLVLNAHVAKERLGTANGIIDASGALARMSAPLLAAKLYE